LSDKWKADLAEALNSAVSYLSQFFGVAADEIKSVVRCDYFLNQVWMIAYLAAGAIPPKVKVTLINWVDAITSDLEEDEIVTVGTMMSSADMKADQTLQIWETEDGNDPVDPYEIKGFGKWADHPWMTDQRHVLTDIPAMHTWEDVNVLLISKRDLAAVGWDNEKWGDGHAYFFGNMRSFIREAYTGPDMTLGCQMRVMRKVSEEVLLNQDNIASKSLTVQPKDTFRQCVEKVLDRREIRHKVDLTRLLVITEDSIKIKRPDLVLKTMILKDCVVSMINTPAMNHRANCGPQSRAFWTSAQMDEMAEHLGHDYFSERARACFGDFTVDRTETVTKTVGEEIVYETVTRYHDKVNLGARNEVSKLANGGFFPSQVFGTEYETKEGETRQTRDMFREQQVRAQKDCNKWDFRHLGARTYIEANDPKVPREVVLPAIGMLKRIGSSIQDFDYILFDRSPSVLPKGQATIAKYDVEEYFDDLGESYTYEEWIDESVECHSVDIRGTRCYYVEGILWSANNMHGMHPDWAKYILLGDFDGDTALGLLFPEYREPVFQAYEPETEKIAKDDPSQVRTFEAFKVNAHRNYDSSVAIPMVSAMWNGAIEDAKTARAMGKRRVLDPDTDASCVAGAGINVFIDMVKRSPKPFRMGSQMVDSIETYARGLWEMCHPGQRWNGWKAEGGNAVYPARRGYQKLGIGNPEMLVNKDEIPEPSAEDIALAWTAEAKRLKRRDVWTHSHCHRHLLEAVHAQVERPVNVNVVDNQDLLTQLEVKMAELPIDDVIQDLDDYIADMLEVLEATKEFQETWVKGEAIRLLNEDLNSWPKENVRKLTLRLMQCELEDVFLQRTLQHTLTLATEDFWVWFWSGFELSE